MKRNLLNLLPLLCLLLVPGLVNAQDTNAPAATTPAPAVAATNALPDAVVQTNAPASTDDDVSPGLKAAMAARAASTPIAPITPTADPASKALVSNATDDVNPTLKALAANAGPLTDPNTLVTKVSERNIFNPYRVKNVIYTNTNSIRVPQPRSEWFSLQGTSRNDDVWAAFFDGTSSQYRRALQIGDTIAGYRIAEIAADYIMLSAASNKMVKLPMQSQMKRSGTGPWSVGRSAYGSMASETSGDAALIDTVTDDGSGGGGAGNDALRRLLAKRLKDE